MQEVTRQLIRVLHVITDNNIGGAGKWLVNFFNNVNRSAFSYDVIVPCESNLSHMIEETGTSVCRLKGLDEKSLDIKSIKPLFNMIRCKKPDIVHTHASLSARLAARIAGVKGIINTKHCLDAKTGTAKKFISKHVNKLLSDKIIAISYAVRNNLLDAGIPGQRISVIYNGVDPVINLDEEEKTKVRTQLGIRPNEQVIGILARLEEIKGHKYFLKAAVRVVEKFEKVRFVIAGTGSLTNDLKSMSKSYGIKDKVIFTGHVKDTFKVFSIIDINVITSLSEAFCLSLIEGMSAGKPGIGTNTGGIVEIIENGSNGFIVPPADEKALADAMLTLLNNTAIKNEMGRKGKRIYNKKFTALKMAEMTEKLYKEIINIKK